MIGFVKIFLKSIFSKKFIGALALELDLWTTQSVNGDFTLEAGSKFEVE